MLPLATIGSTRFCPLTDAYVGLARHFHTGCAVSACAPGTTHSTPVAAASATRSLRIILFLPLLLWMTPTSGRRPLPSVSFAPVAPDSCFRGETRARGRGRVTPSAH